MIELPNGKVARTLQEQVGYNSKKITEIIQALNNLDVKDYDYFTLESSSGTLTEEQQALVQAAKAFIVYDDVLFMKRRQDATNIDFYAVGVDIQDEVGYKLLNQYRIRITVSTMAYQYDELTFEVDEVKANPTLDGGEDPLTALEVKGVKYGLSGGKIYMHNIKITASGYGISTFRFFSSDNTPMTKATLSSWLYDQGFTDEASCFPVNPFILITSGGGTLFHYGIANASGLSADLKMFYQLQTAFSTVTKANIYASSISDTVIEM